MLLNGGRPGDTRLLAPSTVALMPLGPQGGFYRHMVRYLAYQALTAPY